MKKLKIFLLLSILLCFGFALSSEVHAQGGPKIFEVGDVLPATTQLKIILKIDYDDEYIFIVSEDEVTIVDCEYLFTYNDVTEEYELDDTSSYVQIMGEDFSIYEDSVVIIDTSNWSLAERTILTADNAHNVTWEDLAPAPTGYTITFEENGGTTQTDLTEQTALPDPLPTPTKSGYTFVGWYYDSDFTNEAFASDPLTDDVTLYARWLPGKLFEVDDVLSATTQLKIRILFGQGDYHVETVDRSGIYLSIDWIGGVKDFYLEIGGLVRYDGEVTASEIYYTYDISNWSLDQRTIKSVSSENGTFVTWEDLAPAPTGYTITFEENGGTTQTDLTEQTALPDPLPTPTKENHTFLGWYYDSDFTNEAFAGDPLTDDVTLYARWLPGKLFEEGDVLPATTQLKIRILFGQGDYHVETVDRSGIYLSIDWIGGVKDFYLEIDGLVQYDGEVTASEIYYTIDTLDWSLNQRTIKSVSSENGTFVTWEDITPDGYTQGYLEAREEFGYYDSRTNEWLSVDEYLDLYGTEKMGQSDFYNNFDKYFIPAMIIVFGGAIVLTVLKVFKGRE
jgi:uncharacterized repeat protein (TIGR02543 family)